MERVAIFLQRYFMHKGFKKFGQEGRDVLTKEMEQFNRRNCFGPVYIRELTPQEKGSDKEAINILDQKSTTKKLKGRMLFNVKPTREWLSG